MAFRNGWVRRWIVGLIVAGASLRPLPALADSSRAGVVILPAPGATPTIVCVAFPEKELTGIDLLRRAQPDLITQVSLAGEAVCKIGSTGCDYPAQDCFCACRGAECLYWSYWYREGEHWVYSPRGGHLRTVRHGDLDAWVWGDGQTAPPEMVWEDVCLSQPSALAGQSVQQPSAPNTPPPAQGEPYPGLTNTPAPTATPKANNPYPGPAPTETPIPSPTETIPPTPTATERPSPTARTVTPTELPQPTEPRRPTQPFTRQPSETPWPTTAPQTPIPSPALAISPTAALAVETAIVLTATPDRVAQKIREGVASARATAQARESAAPSAVRQYGAFVALVIALGALIGGLAITRRRRAAAALRPLEPPTKAPPPGNDRPPDEGED